jgi:hypothetical protein
LDAEIGEPIGCLLQGNWQVSAGEIGVDLKVGLLNRSILVLGKVDGFETD